METFVGVVDYGKDPSVRQEIYVTPPSIRTLVAQTKFSVEELRHLYKGFKNVRFKALLLLLFVSVAPKDI